METFKTFTEILSAISPIVIGAIVAYIAYQQHLTNRNRLKMELFGRRYKIYDAVITIITTNFDDFRDDTVECLHRDLSAARFLFDSDEDVLDLTKKVIEAAHGIVTYRREQGIPDDSDKELDEDQSQAAKDLSKNLWKLRQEAIEVFSTYLTLSVAQKYRENTIAAFATGCAIVLIVWLVSCCL